MFAGIVAKGGVVRAIRAPKAAGQPRSFFDKLNSWAQGEGKPGLGYISLEGGAGKGPIAKFVADDRLAKLKALTGAEDGDAVFFVADQPDAAWKFAGHARTRIGQELGVIARGRVRLLLDRRLPDVRVRRQGQEGRLQPQPVLDAAGRAGGAGDARIR